MSKRKVFSLALFYFGISSAFAQVVSSEEVAPTVSNPLGSVASVFSGRVFTDVYVPTGQVLDSDFQQISGSIWIQADPKLGDNSSAHMAFTVDDFLASSVSGNTQLRTRLREGYVEYVKLGWEFRAGKIIIPWGKSDVVNPTDFLSAKDYTFFNPDEEVRRTGSVAFSLAWTPSEGTSPWTFTLIAVPVFAQSRLLLAPGQVPATVLLASSPQTPSASLSNTETAVKIAYNGNQWDASVSIFRGWNHLPEFQATSITVVPTLSVQAAQVFHRYKALGADASLTFGKWILRGEAAYVWTENDNGLNPLIQPSHFDSVFGLERPLGEDFRVQAQFLLRYFPIFSSLSSVGGANAAEVAVNESLARTNALVQNYQDRIRPAGTFRFSYSNEESGIEAELFLMGNFLGGGYFARPQLSYAWSDSLKSTLGLNYYGGPTSSPLGVLSPYNAVYTEAKYTF